MGIVCHVVMPQSVRYPMVENQPIKLLFVWLSLAVAAPVGADAPFGVPMGTEPAKLRNCKPGADNTEPDVYVCDRLPKVHPLLKSYYVWAPAATGVCTIDAFSGLIKGDPTGQATRELADRLAEQVAVTYGQWGKDEWHTADSPLSTPARWLEGIFEKENGYEYVWEGWGGKPLPEDVSRIVIKVIAHAVDTGSIYVRFTYRNFSECDAASEKAQAAVF